MGSDRGRTIAHHPQAERYDSKCVDIYSLSNAHCVCVLQGRWKNIAEQRGFGDFEDFDPRNIITLYYPTHKLVDDKKSGIFLPVGTPSSRMNRLLNSYGRSAGISSCKTETFHRLYRSTTTKTVGNQQAPKSSFSMRTHLLIQENRICKMIIECKHKTPLTTLSWCLPTISPCMA